MEARPLPRTQGRGAKSGIKLPLVPCLLLTRKRVLNEASTVDALRRRDSEERTGAFTDPGITRDSHSQLRCELVQQNLFRFQWADSGSLERTEREKKLHLFPTTSVSLKARVLNNAEDGNIAHVIRELAFYTAPVQKR